MRSVPPAITRAPSTSSSTTAQYKRPFPTRKAPTSSVKWLPYTTRDFSGTQDRIQLYIDGNLEANTVVAAGNLNDWEGNNNAGLGNTASSLAEGLPVGVGQFAGDIAKFRFYETAINAGGVESLFDLVNAGTALNATTSGYVGITGAYSFTGVQPGVESVAGNPTDGSASFEIWFRPDADSDVDVLYEIGGGTGTSITYDGSSGDVSFSIDSGSNLTISGAPTGTPISNTEFNQVVATIEVQAGALLDTMTLYVNGEEVATGTAANLDDWAGSDLGGVGRIGNAITALSSGATQFEGEIAIFNMYGGVPQLRRGGKHLQQRDRRQPACSRPAGLSGGRRPGRRRQRPARHHRLLRLRRHGCRHVRQRSRHRQRLQRARG